MYAVLFVGFAVFALVIAGAGLFGVLSQSVSQRSRELAVRTALGASRGAVIGVALKQMGVAMIAGVIDRVGGIGGVVEQPRAVYLRRVDARLAQFRRRADRAADRRRDRLHRARAASGADGSGSGLTRNVRGAVVQTRCAGRD